MRSRKFFAFFPLLSLLVSIFIFIPWGNVSSGAGIIPLNVVVLPPVITDKRYNGGQEVVEKLQAKIIRHFRYPYYEIIAPDNLYSTLPAADSVNGMTDSVTGTADSVTGSSLMKKPYDKDIMQNIAQNLSADIVVVAEIVKARSHTYKRGMLFDGDIYLETNVVLNCYTYCAKDGKYNKATISNYNCDVVGFSDTLDTLVPNLTVDMLAKIPYKTIIKEE